MDPVTAIRQQFDVLIQQGRFQEADLLMQEFLNKRTQHGQVNMRMSGQGNRK